jgi:hypothetical protein
MTHVIAGMESHPMDMDRMVDMENCLEPFVWFERLHSTSEFPISYSCSEIITLACIATFVMAQSRWMPKEGIFIKASIYYLPPQYENHILQNLHSNTIRYIMTVDEQWYQITHTSV